MSQSITLCPIPGGAPPAQGGVHPLDIALFLYLVLLCRRTLYYLFNIIFPCLWLTILSLLGFWLPPDSGEKITLGITVLLAFSVFMLLIAESMPATSEFVPLIGGCFELTRVVFDKHCSKVFQQAKQATTTCWSLIHGFLLGCVFVPGDS